MGKIQQEKLKERNEDLEDLLEDLLTQIQELREEFTSALDEIEDMIISVRRQEIKSSLWQLRAPP